MQIMAVLAAGLVAGFVNTLAGGGSFLTLVALQYAGLSGVMANGTNRVAIAVQTLTAVLGFRSQGVHDLRLSLRFAIPTLLGAILGATVVIDLPEVAFRRALAVAMLFMLVIVVFDLKGRLGNRQAEMAPRRWWLIFPIFFAVGFYGGAIQAGVGFLLITALVLFAGQDLVHAVSHVAFIVATYTLVVLALFASKGQVNWVLGLVLSAGNATGAWVASRMAVANGDRIVRVVLGIMLALMAVRYLDLIPGF